MKKLNFIISCALIISLLLSIMVFVTADANSVKLGDVNGDGDITAADALEVLQYSVGKIDKFSGETSSQSESPSEPEPHFLAFTLKEFTDWINNGGDDEAANQEFLKFVNEQKKLLITKAKKEELKEYCCEVVPYKPEAFYEWAIDEDDMSSRQLFDINVFLPTAETKDMQLDELYYYYIPDVCYSVDIMSGERNGVNYHYKDSLRDDKGNYLSVPHAWFMVDGYFVVITARWTLQEKPFNPEYLDYFDYETIELNIEK